MRQSAVIDWVHDEIVATLTATGLVSLASPAQHVGVVTERTHGDGPDVYPFVGIRTLASRNTQAGIGSGEAYVDSTTYQNGVLQSVTYRREPTLRLELVVVTDADARLRADIAEDLSDHFATLVRTGGTPADLTIESVTEATPEDRAEELVRADGVGLEIAYDRYETDDDPDVAETVNLDVDVTETEPDATDDTETDAFDESF